MGSSIPASRCTLLHQTLSLYDVAVDNFTDAHCQPGGPKFPDTCSIVTEGWWTLPANACVSPIKEELSNRFYYFFAMDLYGNDATEGDKEFCVNVNKYFRDAIQADDLERPACWVRGIQKVKFKEIDTGIQTPETLKAAG